MLIIINQCTPPLRKILDPPLPFTIDYTANNDIIDTRTCQSRGRGVIAYANIRVRKLILKALRK